MLILCCFGSPPRRPKRVPRGPKTPQERPKRLQEAPKSAPGGSKRASRDPKRCQELPKTPTKLFRSTWSGSRFRKNKKIESIRPQGFSEALGPAVVFGKMEKFKAWLQKASKTLKIADIDESQRPCHNSQNEKRRAGGGDPPWGSQSAATRRVGACLNRIPISCQYLTIKPGHAHSASSPELAGVGSPGPPKSVQNRSKNRSKF